MLKPRTVLIGAALVGAVCCGALIWQVNRGPGTLALSRAAAGDTPKARLRLISPGVLRFALELRNTSPAGLALLGDGTTVVGATTSAKLVSPPAGDKDRAVVLRLSPDGRPAPPAVTLLGTAPSAVSGLASGRDGTVVAAGYGSAAEQGTPGPATDRQFLLARLRSDGVLDPAFGGGAVLANLRASLWQGAAAHAVALQGDGSVVATGVAGFAAGAFEHGSYCATARFNQDGRFDRTFGDSGRVLSLIAGRNCGAVAVFVASDGKILVVGSTPAPAIVLLRYLADGTPDRRFGRDGAAQFFDATGWGAALDSHDRVIVVGTKWQSQSDTQFLIARYDPDGSLDPSFGASGAVLLHEAPVSQVLSAAAVQPDGKIVAVGTFGWHSGTRPPEPGKRDQIVVVRLDANGALDRSFAEGGLLFMASPQYLWGGRAVAVQPDGKLLIVGPVLDEVSDRGIVFVRLKPDGTPDADFGAP